MPRGLPGGGGEMLNFRIDRRIKQIPDFILFDEIYGLFRDNYSIKMRKLVLYLQLLQIL